MQVGGFAPFRSLPLQLPFHRGPSCSALQPSLPSARACLPQPLTNCRDAGSILITACLLPHWLPCAGLRTSPPVAVASNLRISSVQVLQRS